jgi:agmatinase
MREEYLGETLSHSTVMRKITGFLDPQRLHQIGIRSGTEEEFQQAKGMKSIVPLNGPSLRNLVKRLKGKPVYVSLDLDVIDPGSLSGVGTPEPGGISFREFLSLLKVLQSLRVIGFDIVELTPDYDPTQVSSVTASVILREMILSFCHR